MPNGVICPYRDVRTRNFYHIAYEQSEYISHLLLQYIGLQRNISQITLQRRYYGKTVYKGIGHRIGC